MVGGEASVPDPKFAWMCGKCFCELRVQRDTSTIKLPVSLLFGSSLRCRCGVLANFRTATLAVDRMAAQGDHAAAIEGSYVQQVASHARLRRLRNHPAADRRPRQAGRH